MVGPVCSRRVVTGELACVSGLIASCPYVGRRNFSVAPDVSWSRCGLIIIWETTISPPSSRVNAALPRAAFGDRRLRRPFLVGSSTFSVKLIRNLRG